MHFEAKQARHFDPEIAAYLDASGLEQQMARLLDSEFDHRVTWLHWTGQVAVRVDGVPDRRLVEAAMTAEAHHRVTETLATRLLTGVMTVPLRSKRRRRPIAFDDVVRHEFRRGRGEMLERRVYRLDAGASAS
jgi:hypothetical protein